jgi:hypothetical protein
MLLSEFFEHLTFGELSQLFLTGNGVEIEAREYPKIAAHLNLALTALYSRFPLRTEEIIVQEYDDITMYFLRPEFAVNSGSAEAIKYLVDTVNYPFVGRVLKIEQAFNEDGEEILLNDDRYADSIYTPQFDVIQIPEPVATNSVSILYRANHDKVVIAPSTDLTTVNLNIPDFLITPIKYYMANNLISPLAGENEGIGNNFLAKYEQECQRIEMQGLFNPDTLLDERLKAGGWV